MTQRIRALERQLACHLAYIVAEPIADAYIETWEQAIEDHAPLPDVLTLVQALVKERIAVLAMIPITSYLDQCAKDNRLPNPDRLTETIVHGYTETRLHLETNCRCQRPL